MINIFEINPHQISRDLSGYITYIYGAPKVGKTTLGAEMPKPLLLAFERGYNALAGIKAADITKWSELKQIVRDLAKPEAKEMYSTIIIDTVDIAAALCEKFVCSQAGVNAIGEVPYGQGWTMLKKEFEDTFRAITQQGYAVYFIAHYKEGIFKNPDGSEYSIIRPSVSDTYNRIIENMADIYGYMYVDKTEAGSVRKIRLRSQDATVACGCRFKFIAEETGATYDELVKTINKAIDGEAQVKGQASVTNEKNVFIRQELDFDQLKVNFDQLINKLVNTHSEEEFQNVWSPKIVQITEKYLGKGKKASQCTRDQVEMLSCIVSDLEDLTK